MRIAVIGTGYVGLVVGTCLADMGNDVICVDKDVEKLESLKKGIITIYEPGLEELVRSNLIEKRLRFSSDIDQAIQFSEVCFIAVGTPQSEDGSCDLQYVMDVVRHIANSMNEYKVIVNKSTVPVGTADTIVKYLQQNTKYPFDVVSNPEFLKQGNALNDFLHPDRVIIGSNSEKATFIMQELYAPFFRTGERIIVMDIKSAEMTKYASNSFLATKISFMNEIANLCEKVGANVEMVRVGMGADPRIGSKFLFPGLGYGGSCFPKDVRALIKTGIDNNYKMRIVEMVDYVNVKQRNIFMEKIKKYFNNKLEGLTVGVWGLTFKPNTDDMREAPSITIISNLLSSGVNIKVFDPKGYKSAKFYFQDRIVYCKHQYEALEDADCMLLLTEWNEFRRPDFIRIKSLLKKPIIFDGRNQYCRDRLKLMGFECFQIGKI